VTANRNPGQNVEYPRDFIRDRRDIDSVAEPLHHFGNEDRPNQID